VENEVGGTVKVLVIGFEVLLLVRLEVDDGVVTPLLVIDRWLPVDSTVVGEEWEVVILVVTLPVPVVESDVESDDEDLDEGGLDDEDPDDEDLDEDPDGRELDDEDPDAGNLDDDDPDAGDLDDEDLDDEDPDDEAPDDGLWLVVEALTELLEEVDENPLTREEVLLKRLLEDDIPVSMEDCGDEVAEEDTLESPDGPSLAVFPSIAKVPLDPKEIVCPSIVCSADPGLIVVLSRIKTELLPVATTPDAKVTVS
jgi:hypothetical protein